MKEIIGLALILTLATISFGQATTPEATAKGLWNTWKQNDKTTAAKFARAKVISFIWKFNISKFEMDDYCNKYKGETHCFYRDNDGGVLNLTMTKFGKTWKAKSVIYVLD